MNAHLVIKANNKERVLKGDESISIEMQNPLWRESVEMFSYPISLPIEGNRDLLKNIDDPNSDINPMSMEHTPMQIIVDGMPFASGPMVINDDDEISDAVSINIDASTEDFNSMIGDLQCRDIPIPDEDMPSLIIGEKISNVEVSVDYDFEVKVGGIKFLGDKEDGNWDISAKTKMQSATKIIEPQALGFSYPAKCKQDSDTYVAEKERDINYGNQITLTKPKVEESYINVTDEYMGNKRGSSLGGAKFCNARICYKHYGADNGETSNSVVTGVQKSGPEDYGPYWVLDADRPQSGICFYVLYFLECLFKHLKVDYDISALLNVEDLKHLCFFTTRCSYKTVPLNDRHQGPYFYKHVGGSFNVKDREVTDDERKHLFDAVNMWMESRGCGGKLELEPLSQMNVNEISLSGLTHFDNGTYRIGEKKKIPDFNQYYRTDQIEITPHLYSARMSAYISNMVADEGNFPEMAVSSLLTSLENMFGINFAYDYGLRKVTAYLLRDVLSTNSKPRIFRGNILSINRVSEKITGVRIGYSEEQEAQEQKDNVKYGIRNYDTAFNYIDFPDPAKSTSLKTTIIDKTYKDFFRTPSHGDENVYIDQNTGYAYRVKVDEDATTAQEMHPVWFRVGHYKGVEEGDCSDKNEDYVQEFLSDLVPVDFNDVNRYSALEYSDAGIQLEEGASITGINSSGKKSLLAAYMPDDMEHEFIEQRIRQNVASEYINAYVTEVLTLVESYNPQDTEDGNSPLQHYNWGNAIAMMRGGGANAKIEQYESNYDGFGNNKWRMLQGTYALASDSIDQWGEVYDYNGEMEGGYGEHFSLSPRAYKQPSWADHPLCAPDQTNPWTGERIRVQSRGYVDTFLLEYIYFLLHRKKFRLKCFCNVAQVIDIQNHWHDWWLIDGKKCLINRVNADLSVSDGLGEVELEVYAI